MITKDDEIRIQSVNWLQYHANGGVLTVGNYIRANNGQPTIGQ